MIDGGHISSHVMRRSTVIKTLVENMETFLLNTNYGHSLLDNKIAY